MVCCRAGCRTCCVQTRCGSYSVPSARPPSYPHQAVPVTKQHDPGEINTNLKVAMRVTIINYRISLIIFLGMLVAAVIRIISLVVLSSWQNFRIFKRSTLLLAHKPSVALLTLPSLWQLNLFVIIMSSGRQNWHATLGHWQFSATAADETLNSRNTLHCLSCSHRAAVFRSWQNIVL